MAFHRQGVRGVVAFHRGKLPKITGHLCKGPSLLAFFGGDQRLGRPDDQHSFGRGPLQPRPGRLDLGEFPQASPVAHKRKTSPSERKNTFSGFFCAHSLLRLPRGLPLPIKSSYVNFPKAGTSRLFSHLIKSRACAKLAPGCEPQDVVVEASAGRSFCFIGPQPMGAYNPSFLSSWSPTASRSNPAFSRGSGRSSL